MGKSTAGFVLAVFLLFSSLLSAQAQNSSCTVNMPVVLVDKQGNLLGGASPKDLTIEVHRQKLAIESLSYDTGPRRVLFIVDTGRHLPAEVRKMEYTLITHLMETARTGDTFGLLTTRGALRQVRFEDGNGAVNRAVLELFADAREDKKAGPMMDTIAEGLTWFGAPQPGDAILLMSDQLVPYDTLSQLRGGYAVDVRPLNESSKTTFKKLTELLALHKVRAFGIQFSGVLHDPYTYEATDENLAGLCIGSGGYVIVDAMTPFGGYQLTSARIDGLQKRVYQLTGAIAEYYVAKLKAPAAAEKQQWRIELARDLRNNTYALYPRWVGACDNE
ncbi:MAG TPA: hypothetical protein VE783_10555 [Candidatus Limnocylindrales bacterium]|jgi:hypothetical protein|nr:hypothetical protein [Candidatus Limnocylindrales bacterium]